MSSHPSAGPPAPPIASLRLQEKVPFITAWSGESFDDPRMVWRGRALGYAGERPRDRDAFGVLWRRATNAPGSGGPRYGAVHPARQRRAMGGMLCQVCARPTRPEATEDGILFLLGRHEYECDPWPAPIDTTHPPVCVRCARTAVNACPHLRGHYVAVRCRAPRLYGVAGIVHAAAGDDGTPPDSTARTIATVAYSSPRRFLVQAAQVVARLERYAVVDLDSPSPAPAP